MATALIILGAGMGTRMNSDLPKVLHPIAGAPMLVHAMKSGAALQPERTVVVAGYGADAVEKAAKAYDPDTKVVIQSEQLGTAHAVAQAKEALKDFAGDVLMLLGDAPFIKTQTMQDMLDRLRSPDAPAVVVLGFEPADPLQYGRVITHADNTIEKMVEFKDANEAERACRL